MAETICIHITGKVQGVFFRQSTRDKAIELGISGTVRNLEDGRVEVIATGTKAQLKDLTEWCNHGPPRAVVTNIISTPLPLQPFRNFIVVRS